MGFIEHENYEKISNSELLELSCDCLCLSALENQITKDNATKIKATSILELANGPTTFEADKILTEKGVKVYPDVFALRLSQQELMYFYIVLSKCVIGGKFILVCIGSYNAISLFKLDYSQAMPSMQVCSELAIIFYCFEQVCDWREFLF